MQDFYFLACPLFVDGTQCMIKVFNHLDGMWHCNKCDGDFPECDYRYVLKLEMHDHTGLLQNVTAFNDAATKLLGITAKDLFLLSAEPIAIHEICSKVSCRHFLFTLSVKTDCFNGVDRLKVVLFNSEEMNYGAAPHMQLMGRSRPRQWSPW